VVRLHSEEERVRTHRPGAASGPATPVPLLKDICYPSLSLLRLRAGAASGFARPPARRLAPVGTKRCFPP